MNKTREYAKNNIILFFLKLAVLLFFLMFFSPGISAAILEEQDEPLSEQIRSAVQHEAFTLNLLLQGGFRFSLEDDDFQGGRTFEAANARLNLRGTIDRRFFYRLQLNMVREPNLLDAFVGYKLHDAFRITAGAMKPQQSPDFIPGAHETDFIDRTRISGLLVNAREIGVSAEGDIGGFYYYAGIFNGTRLESNNNNKFYGIGRLQYTIAHNNTGKVRLGVQGSHGNSPGVFSGSSGPLLRGKRTIYGSDIRIETERFLLLAEFISGDATISYKYEDDETNYWPSPPVISEIDENISGYYITSGYNLFSNTMFLARWQSWGYKEAGWRDNQLTFGVNHDFTSLASFQFNFDTYLPYNIDEDKDNQYGISLILQVYF